MIFLEGALLTGLFFLLFITFVLLRNRFQFKGIADSERSTDTELSVAICIPARNEEKVIRACLDLALSQNYRNTKVYVLDDRSTDSTPQILEQFKARYPETLTIARGKERPADWLGKPYACHQLSELAREDILIFIDADTWMQPELVSRVVGAFNRNNIDFITIWPEQRLHTFWEKTVVPLVYYALLGLLPVAYTERKPRWMPAFFHEKYRSLFAAACGQFMAFRAETYRQIDGHEAVKNHIVEDVMLAREVIDHGFRMRMFHGRDAFFCRMYTSERDIFEGFRKNFLAGFDYNVPLFMLMAMMHFVSFLLPLLVLAAAIFLPVSGTAIALSAGMVLLYTLHRLLLAAWMRWDGSYAITHALGVGWFQRLGLITLTDYLQGRSITWKGDDIRHPK